MPELHTTRRAAAALACCLLASCVSAGGLPQNATAMSGSRTQFFRPHWSRVSIGKFADPYGVVADGSGNVYVADPGSKSIVEIGANGERKTVGDFSLAAGSKFDPQGVALGSAPFALWVADKGNGEIWYVKPDNSVGTGYGPVASPLYARAVATSQNKRAVYVALASSLPLTTKGQVRCVRGECKVFAEHAFADPYGVAVDDRGDVYVADARAKAAFLVDKSGASEIGHFADPYGIAVTPDGSHVYVADAGAKKVFEWTPSDGWADIGTFTDPYGVAVTPDGSHVYVADAGSKDVWKLTP